MMYKIRVGLACDLCGECVEVCSGKVLTEELLELLKTHDHAPNYSVDCTFCETCMEVCPENAIRVDVID